MQTVNSFVIHHSFYYSSSFCLNFTRKINLDLHSKCLVLEKCRLAMETFNAVCDIKIRAFTRPDFRFSS